MFPVLIPLLLLFFSGFLFSRNISIKTDSAGTVVFEDILGDGPDAVTFRERAYINGIDYNVLEENYRASGKSFMMVAQKDGEIFKIDGKPVMSPDQKYFVTVPPQVVAKNRIQIYEMVNNKPALKATFFGGDLWIPKNPQWIDNKTVRFSKTFFRDVENLKNTAKVNERITLSEGKWTFPEKYKIKEGQTPGHYEAVLKKDDVPKSGQIDNSFDPFADPPSP